VHVLLADAVGHGLTAAINVLPLCQSFYDLTGKGFSLEEISVELNSLVNKFMPVDRFVSAVLVSSTARRRSSKYGMAEFLRRSYSIAVAACYIAALHEFAAGILPAKNFPPSRSFLLC